MSIVTFYCGDPKNAPKTTQGAHLGGNAILLWQGKLLLERRVDADVWGLPGGGAKKQETARQAVSREIYEELGLRIPGKDFRKLAVYGDPGALPPIGTAASGGWSSCSMAMCFRKSRSCASAGSPGSCVFSPGKRRRGFLWP